MFVPFLIMTFIVLTAACLPRRKLVAVTDFDVEDPELAEIIKNSAKEWADAGVMIAETVTVNEGVQGAMKVRRAPRGNLWVLCNAKQGAAYQGDGCCAIENGQWDGMYIPEDLTDKDRLRVVIMHELAHLLTNQKTHHDQVGILSKNADSATITDADMNFMRQYTECWSPDELPAKG